MRTFLIRCIRRAFTSLAGFAFAFGIAGFVTMMHAGMLRLTPKPIGFSRWVQFLDAATYARVQVINGFFLSTEYHGRFLP